MISVARGDLFEAKVEALVNPVNCLGISGAGLAKQFKERWPENHRAYALECHEGKLWPGKMFTHEIPSAAKESPRWIINFPTKTRWQEPSKIDYIYRGLIGLIGAVKMLEIGSIAIPQLGCGLGGLKWLEIRPMIERAFIALPDIRVILYEA
jgi:O-acetyl-ADP-ribose deacetylase (regulator of RNase III)